MDDHKKYITTQNPESDFLKELDDIVGLEEYPKEGVLLFDGTWQRWGKSRARFRWIGHMSYHNSNQFYQGTFIDLKNEKPKVSLKGFNNNKPLSPRDIKVLAPTIKKVETTVRDLLFDDIIESLKPTTLDNFYLKKKGNLLPYAGMKENERGDLCVPMYSIDGEKVTGIQRITKEAKLNYPGSKLGVFVVGKNTTKVFICEGIADALTLNQLTDLQAICCFGESNMIKVANKLSDENEHQQFVVCADNIRIDQVRANSNMETLADYQNMYVNKFKTKMNIIVKFPFNNEIMQSEENFIKDFNDLYLKDQEFCLRQLNAIGSVPYLKHLGYKAGSSSSVAVYSSKNRDIHLLKDNCKFATLFLLADKDYWDMKFPNMKEKKIVENLFIANSELKYDPSKIRRAGVYLDKNKVVINTGERIIGEISPKYIYLPIGSFPEPNDVPDFEFDSDLWKKLTKVVFPEVAFNNKWDMYLLTACTLLSGISRLLPFRFSIDFRSESSTGKSFLIENYVSPLLNKFEMGLKEIAPKSTVASCRDIMSNYSLVLLEEGNESKHKKFQKESLFESFSDIFRASSTKAQSVYRKGSGETGDFNSSEICCNVIKSYNVLGFGLLQADKNRTIFFDLDRRQKVKKNFKKVIKDFNDDELGDWGQKAVMHLVKNYEAFMITYLNIYLNFHNKEFKSEHKQRIYAELFTCLKMLKLVSDNELEEMLDFYEKKETQESKLSDYIICRENIIHFHYRHGHENLMVKNILKDFIYNEGENSTEKIVYEKFVSETGLKLGLHNKRPGLKVPSFSIYISDQFSKSTNIGFVGNHYDVLKQGYSICRWNSKEGKGIKGVFIPLTDFMSAHDCAKALEAIEGHRYSSRHE